MSDCYQDSKKYAILYNLDLKTVAGNETYIFKMAITFPPAISDFTNYGKRFGAYLIFLYCV